MKKPSFLSRLMNTDDSEYEEYFEEEQVPQTREYERREVRTQHVGPQAYQTRHRHEEEHTDEPVGELSVDVYQTADMIVIKALVAGVQPGAIDISLTREMLTVSGTREDEKEVDEDGYFQRELYWGPFSRTILLPEEVDVDLAEASERHGILMIRLPKINKKRQTKLKVRTR